MDTSLKSCTYSLAAIPDFRTKVLNWLRPFGTFCFLDNQQYSIAPQLTDCLVAAGVRQILSGDDIQTANHLFTQKDWLFGHLSYELKRTLHPLPSIKKDKVGFPPFCFFQPQTVLEINGPVLVVHAADPDNVFTQIQQQPGIGPDEHGAGVQPQPVLERDVYLQKIAALQQHIRRGDCYEINFCQEFFAAGATIDPFAVFKNLMEVSPNPFSAFYRLDDKFLLCASPERFLARKGNRLISQPIKGTVARNRLNKVQDQALKDSLRLSPKEQSENVMVVDLVRNDLTRICKPTTVRVDELFGIYSFPQVHQMISTISGEIEEDLSFSEILKATFPMGSMTGAPKLRVMQLIDEFEPSARGLFSGSVGYKAPNGDFDFNVVIRSILYNQLSRYLSYQVGSGITFYSDAEKEWEECLLKASAIQQVLSR